MAFERILEQIRQIKRNLTDNREAEALKIAFDQVALTKLRIQTKGESAAGSPFEGYVAPYAKERKSAGYQVGYVDFTRTGRMWANVAPRVERSTIFSATVIIEGAEKRAKDIIAGAARKRGNILQPSRHEIELIRAANRERVKRAFNLQ